MSATPTSPQLLRAGFLVLDAATGAVARILPFQYNPQQLVHSLAPEGESYTVVAEYGVCTEFSAEQDVESEFGIAPQLAALRSIASDPSGARGRAGVGPVPGYAGPLPLADRDRDAV